MLATLKPPSTKPDVAHPLWERIDEIRARIQNSGRLLLLLDFDGTLAPIVADPSAARLPLPVRDLLVSLVGSRSTLPAVISGRALDDVRTRVGIPGLTYAGNHGLEIEGPGFRFVQPEAERLRPLIAGACMSLSRRLRGVPGVEVEDKGLTAAVHYRNAPESQNRVIEAVWDEVVRRDRGLALRMGKMICEVRPAVDWNKGSAALWLCSRLADGETVLPICAGDDQTDEDAFAALPGGVTVKVGDPLGTAAAYYVAGPDDVGQFLKWIGETCQ
ncbi:MAG TPA: trehalose-phosphatase [Bryobacteraceae bacterium]|nr:trehalose-phosphatase [Bryobacteraceae bacterium]